MKKKSMLQTLSHVKYTAIKIEDQVKSLALTMCIIFTVPSNIPKLGPCWIVLDAAQNHRKTGYLLRKK